MWILQKLKSNFMANPRLQVQLKSISMKNFKDILILLELQMLYNKFPVLLLNVSNSS